MSFRPLRFRIADCAFNERLLVHSEIGNRKSTILMLRPRLELGSRTNLVLAGYKPAALPIELPEQFKQLVRP